MCWGILSEVCLSWGQSQLTPSRCMSLLMLNWFCILKQKYVLITNSFFYYFLADGSQMHICVYLLSHRMSSVCRFSHFLLSLLKIKKGRRKKKKKQGMRTEDNWQRAKTWGLTTECILTATDSRKPVLTGKDADISRRCARTSGREQQNLN